MSLGSRLALLFGLLALGVSAAVSLSAFRSTDAELALSTDAFLRTRAVEVADGIRTTPQGRRPRDTSDALPFDPDSIVQSLGKDGGITGSSGGELPVSAATLDVARSDPPRNSTPASRYEDITLDGESYRMFVLGLSGGGAVQVARATTESDAVLSGLATRFVLIGAVASLVAALVGWLVARRTTKPLRRLTEVAAEIAETRDFATDVAVDRTDEIGRLARSFQQMLTALEASREQQHRLVHDAGHELRTPLTSLRANVQLLERARELPEAEQVEVLGAIRAELVELSHLFDELMELATDEHDRDAAVEPCDLDDVVRRAVQRWERRSGRTIGVTSSPAVVLGDRQMLERAVTNLLGNAAKFSPPGTAIDVIAGDGAVMVRDRGPGVPAEDRARIFDRFYRSNATRTMPGSGLGLAIVAQIVEQHGGSVWATDAPGGGAEIGFRLPRRGGDSSPDDNPPDGGRLPA